MFSASGAGSGGVQARTGPELLEIQTEAVGFLALGGETKLQLLPSGWPSDALPKPTSSLLSIASKSGLLAAASPDQLVIGTTDAVREAFKKETSPDANNIIKFTPQLSIPIPRVSQVAFSSDESTLTICADQGGGLAVYDVQALKQGNTQSAFQIGTNGISVRALIPNPAEDNAHILAIVLCEGQLMLANLKERQFINGSNGPILREGVSCVSWSARGKQLVAGLGSGQAVQMAPDGTVKAEIPRPPDLQGDQHMSTISWLSNDEFFAVYTPTQAEYQNMPDSTFVLISREPKTTNFAFQKIPDPCGVFGMNRSPPHHFISRLRKYPPDLEDVLIISSTGSGDVGLITNSAKPLSGDTNATANNGKYTMTSMANDARRAQLPIGDMSDSSPIGTALDLSSKEPVKRPIPAEEIDATSTPLPAFMALNNEGVLSAWWFVYSDSVRQGTWFPGLVAAPPEATQQQARPQSQPQQPQQPPSGFGAFAQSQSAFGASTSSPSPFGASTSQPSFGSPSTPSNSAFGSASAFGGAAALGSKQSVWGSGGANTSTPKTGGAAFGQSTFGAPTPMTGGTGFGAAANLGNRQSPWASAGNQQSSTSTENKPNPFPGGSNSAASPFGSMGGAQSSGFANLAGASGNASSPFGGLPQQQKSVFGASSTKPTGMSADPSFGSEVTLGSSFGTMGSGKSPWVTPSLSNDTSGKSMFGSQQPQEAEINTGDTDMESTATEKPAASEQKKEEASKSLFGTSGAGFKLGSTFKGDGTAKDDLPKPDGTSMFGLGFGKALGEAEKSSKPEDPPIKQEPKESTGTQPPASTASPSPSKEPETSKPQEKAAVQKPAPLPPSPKQQLPDSAPAPLPPSPTSQVAPEPAPLLPSENVQPNAPEPAPFPPSPKPEQTKPNPERLPPSPEPQVAPEPAPLPPSPKPQPDDSEEQEPSPAGTSPVDLGASEESFSSDRKGEATENEIKAPEGPISGKQTQKPSWSFPMAPKSPDEPSSQAQTDTPQSMQFSYTPPSASKSPSEAPTSSIQPPLFFPKPVAGQESPRSPSPVRNQQPSFSLASPTPPRPTQSQTSTTPLIPPPKQRPAQATSKPAFPSRLAPVEEVQSERSSQANSDVEPEPVEDYSDIFRAEIARPVEPTKKLEPFMAHYDYTGPVRGQGIPAQIEKVYRDINSMVDTLGLNARALKAFIKGHTEMFPDGGRDRTDLAREDDWCLLEIEDLDIVEKEIADRLESERLQDVPEKLKDLREVLKGLSKLHARHADVQRSLTRMNDPNDTGTTATSKRSRLSTEQTQLLTDLRAHFTKLQTTLAAAEDAASLLRAKLASKQMSSGAGQAAKVPTVEAITKTIAKMTRMAEEKSGDVDMLEAQMRKAGFRPSSARNRSLDDALGSMSLAGTPSPRRRREKRQASPGTYALEYSDSDASEDDNDDDFVDVQADSALRSSTRSFASARSSASSPGKGGAAGFGEITDEDVAEYEANLKRKKTVLELLKNSVVERGPRVRDLTS